VSGVGIGNTGLTRLLLSDPRMIIPIEVKYLEKNVRFFPVKLCVLGNFFYLLILSIPNGLGIQTSLDKICLDSKSLKGGFRI